ncbi:MAG: hypothetical protein IT560_13085 [Alphaproteobacteria bacterium]|nr:hypothetical protein [Alphaproteobacteria bacterium]
MQLRNIISFFLQMIGGGGCVISLIIFVFNVGYQVSASTGTNLMMKFFLIIIPLGFAGIFFGIWGLGRHLSDATKDRATNWLVDEYNKLHYKIMKQKRDRNLLDK